MKRLYFLPTALILFTASCKHTKSSTATSAPPPAPAAPKVMFNNGNPPGDNELNALRATDQSVTMEMLKQGHAIYTGACTNCHTAKNIYSYSRPDWMNILNDMSAKAKLNKADADAVYRYVMSVKALDPFSN